MQKSSACRPAFSHWDTNLLSKLFGLTEDTKVQNGYVQKQYDRAWEVVTCRFRFQTDSSDAINHFYT